MEIVTAFVLIPVVGEFFVELAKEFHLYEHPWPKVEGAMNTLIALANNPTYRIVAALVVGLLIGVLADSFLKRREAKQTAKEALPDEWLSPMEARNRFPIFLNEKEAAIAALEQARRSFEMIARPMLNMGDNNMNAPDLVKARDELNDKQIMYDILSDECIDDIYKQLHSGQLIAKGVPHQHGNNIVFIPKDEWTFLELHFDDETAYMKNMVSSFG